MRSFRVTRRHLRRSGGFFCVFFWLFAGVLLAQDTAKVRTQLEVKGDVWVGQGMTLVVELLSPGFFAGSPTFYLPRVPGVLILQPDERPVLSSEKIDGASYTIQRHELRIFAERPGLVTIPSFEVRFSTRQGAVAPVEHRLQTDPVSMEVKLPPGAEGLATLISAHDLKATEVWQPESGSAKAGDAFTRTITFSAPDIPAMAFPPFTTTDIAGLGVYPKAPRLLDHSERGTDARRAPGNHHLRLPTSWSIRRPCGPVYLVGSRSPSTSKRRFPRTHLRGRTNPALSGLPVASLSNENLNRRAWMVTLGVVAVFSLSSPDLHCGSSRRRPEWWRSIRFWTPVHLAPLNPR